MGKQGGNIARSRRNRKIILLDELNYRPHDAVMAATPYEKTMARALILLSFKPRTVAQMRERLLEKEWAEEAIVDRVVDRPHCADFSPLRVAILHAEPFVDPDLGVRVPVVLAATACSRC